MPGEAQNAAATLAGAGALSAKAVSLDAEASRKGLSIEQRDADLREKVVDRVLPVFLQANRWTLVALGVLALLDEINIGFRLVPPGSPIITSQVIMALLGATTVQVGAIVVAIAGYLFPRRTRQ